MIFPLFVIPKRFERLTHALEGRCSIQLSYGTYLFTQNGQAPICDCKDSAFISLRQSFSAFFCPSSKKEYKEKRNLHLLEQFCPIHNPQNKEHHHTVA